MSQQVQAVLKVKVKMNGEGEKERIADQARCRLSGRTCRSRSFPSHASTDGRALGVLADSFIQHPTPT